MQTHKTKQMKTKWSNLPEKNSEIQSIDSKNDSKPQK